MLHEPSPQPSPMEWERGLDLGDLWGVRNSQDKITYANHKSYRF
jgi:hypothetical protein